MLQNLLSNPGVVSVESLERAHREESRTPPTEMPPMPLQATKADDLEADLKNKLQVKGLANIFATKVIPPRLNETISFLLLVSYIFSLNKPIFN